MGGDFVINLLLFLSLNRVPTPKLGTFLVYNVDGKVTVKSVFSRLLSQVENLCEVPKENLACALEKLQIS